MNMSGTDTSQFLDNLLKLSNVSQSCGWLGALRSFPFAKIVLLSLELTAAVWTVFKRIKTIVTATIATALKQKTKKSW